MESNIIERLKELLLANPAFTDVMGEAEACQLYGGMPPESAVVPFSAYTINEGARVSKDGAGEYEVIIALVFSPNKYNAILAMKNVVKATLGNDVFEYVRADTAYAEEMDAYVSLVYFTITWN